MSTAALHTGLVVAVVHEITLQTGSRRTKKPQLRQKPEAFSSFSPFPNLLFYMLGKTLKC